MLEKAVTAGTLPAIRDRLPAEPAVVDLKKQGKSMGLHGGELRILMGKPKDVRLMMVYGYARLVAYDENYELYPDLLQQIDIVDDREFTLHLRKGHRWSDGHPFTAEDFRYYWEDVANNETLSPGGPRPEMLPLSQAPVFEVVDDHTVRYTWPRPNPAFLPAIAGAAPLLIYRPAHYLKKFHPRYANPEKLREQARAQRFQNWAALHDSKDRQYRFDNPELPTLQPWFNTTKPPSEQFIFERNPYYHRVDPEGRQLPYIDRVIMRLGSTKIIPAKTGSGGSDLQGRYLRFDDYPFLKAGEKRNDYVARLWGTAKGSQVALYPNLNASDPVWRAVLNDRRFRHALSLAINRHQINQVVYFGLAHQSGNTVLPESPLFKKDYAQAWSQHNPYIANQLLDAMGLTKRDDEGIRLLPDGRPIHIIIDTAGESTEQTDVLELIRGTWAEIGVKLFSRPSQREVFRKRVFSGQSIMSIWPGINNGLATAETDPEEFTPSSQQQLQWPKWGRFIQSNGTKGDRALLAPARELVRLNSLWRFTTDRAEKTKIWHQILEIHSAETFSIGIVNKTLQPVVLHRQLRNVPEKGVYNWDPGAYFGIYKPDTFWYAAK